jgi:hypothetical protein
MFDWSGTPCVIVTGGAQKTNAKPPGSIFALANKKIASPQGDDAIRVFH